MWSAFAGIGVLLCLQIVFTILRGVWRHFLRPAKDLRRLGSWAVVTGATDGIGRALLDVLAKKGLNLVIISRTEFKLATVANEVSFKHNVDTKYVVVDFAHTDASVWQRVADALKGLDIGLLINNVGLSYDHPEYFDELPEGTIQDILEVNITSVNQMTRLVLPRMKEQRRGAIVNIGSAAGSIVPSSPLTSVYAGSKAYVDLFSKSLKHEVAQFGLTIQNMAPLFVATKMSKIRKARLDAPTPVQWARSAVDHIGYETTSSPWWFHAIMWWFISVGPSAVMDWYVFNLSAYLKNPTKVVLTGLHRSARLHECEVGDLVDLYPCWSGQISELVACQELCSCRFAQNHTAQVDRSDSAQKQPSLFT